MKSLVARLILLGSAALLLAAPAGDVLLPAEADAGEPEGDDLLLEPGTLSVRPALGTDAAASLESGLRTTSALFQAWDRPPPRAVRTVNRVDDSKIRCGEGLIPCAPLLPLPCCWA